MDISRRGFLRISALAAGGSFIGGTGHAYVREAGFPETAGMLVDTTMCVGCRTCEEVCSEANNLPKPILMDDESIFESKRTTDANVFTVVNRYFKDQKGPVYAKTQCRHCNEPACASACLVKAMEKTQEGPVIYHKDRCIGCRYCMVACPFRIPKFEWAKAIPAIRKCTFCFQRQKKGLMPACAENCPEEAIKFGKREELLEIAKTRIYQNPQTYNHHIYGEHEVGGTGWLYLASVPFKQLDFPMDLGITPYPHFAKGFLSSVPLVLTIWPAFLGGIYAFTNRCDQVRRSEQAINQNEKET